MKEKTIKICPNHQDYEVPLIWTFAFPGAEYWCPYCGYLSGMFGAGEDVEETEELRKRLKAYEKASKKYLKANGILCCAETKYNGKWIPPKDLPSKTYDRYVKESKSWEYEKKMKEGNEQ